MLHTFPKRLPVPKVQVSKRPLRPSYPADLEMLASFMVAMRIGREVQDAHIANQIIILLRRLIARSVFKSEVVVAAPADFVSASFPGSAETPVLRSLTEALEVLPERVCELAEPALLAPLAVSARDCSDGRPPSSFALGRDPFSSELDEMAMVLCRRELLTRLARSIRGRDDPVSWGEESVKSKMARLSFSGSLDVSAVLSGCVWFC